LIGRVARLPEAGFGPDDIGTSTGLERSLSIESFNLFKIWASSSAGLERLPYKQEVTGSIPVPPTNPSGKFQIPKIK
jgi:hypothetical protein